jgi:hypothetical protein
LTDTDQPMRADAERTVLRLQGRIGELVGQVTQCEDVIDQLQTRLQDEVVARVKAEQALQAVTDDAKAVQVDP